MVITSSACSSSTSSDSADVAVGGDSTTSTDGTSGTDGTSATDGTTGTDATDAPAPPFGQPEDITLAEELWSTHMAGYQSWTQPTGTEGTVVSAAPHADYATHYWNAAAVADIAADGAIIAKDNVDDEAGTQVSAVTVMWKKSGFNPEEGDWFFAKFTPAGELMANADGLKLAGKIGKGGAAGCIPCHSAAGGNDFLYFND